MKIAITICRILLGLMFTVFGLNQFFHFIPMQLPAGDAGIFFTGLVKSVYFIPLLGVCQAGAGILLLVNRFVPLALLVLFPINLNILMFHIFLDMKGMPMAIVVLGLNVFLLYAYRNHFLHLKESVSKHAHH